MAEVGVVIIRVVIWPEATNKLAVEVDRRAVVMDKRVAEADRRVGAADSPPRAVVGARRVLAKTLAARMNMVRVVLTGHSTYQHRRLQHRSYRSKRACPQPTGSLQQLERLAYREFGT